MKLTKQVLILIMVLLSIEVANAQKDLLLTPTDDFSQTRKVYVTLLDGTEIIGILKRVYRKKGLITAIKIKDENKVKYRLNSEEINFAYLPISKRGIEQKHYDFFHNVKNWNIDKMWEHLLHNGYTYFESIEVKNKDKSRKVLLQLLNPSFSNKVKVYANPRAINSAFNIGKLTISSDIKSYYISKDNDFAFKIRKRKYKKEFNTLWNCDSVIKKFPRRKWKNLVKHIKAYSECE